MQTAIIDDDPVFLQQFSQQLHKLYPDMQIKTARSDTMLDQETFDLVFLDLDLGPAKNGLQAAAKVPETTGLIYVTAYNDRFSQDVFLQERLPDGYLLKPAEDQRIQALVRKVQERRNPCTLDLEIKGQSISIDCSCIRYIESENHYLNIILPDRSLRIRMQLDDVMSKLPAGFLRCHQSYAINLRHVARLTKQTFTMKDQMDVPVSRSRKKEAVRQWTQWVINHG